MSEEKGKKSHTRQAKLYKIDSHRIVSRKATDHRMPQVVMKAVIKAAKAAILAVIEID